MSERERKGELILEVDSLNVRFRTTDGEVHAVRGVNLDVHAGETVAVVGESGSGKSQIMMALMGLLASNGNAEGSVRFRGSNLLGLPARALNRIRGDRIGMIFQEPMTSLDPLYTVGRQLCEPLVHHQGLSYKAARRKAVELLDLVHIPQPERRMRSYPHELSGGQRQRVMIAMALSNNPDVLIADEPTTALDVTIQAEILSLIDELRKTMNMAVVIISHDLAIVRRIADRVYVMRDGKIMESGAVAQVFNTPRDEYTKMLLAAEPEGRKPPLDHDARAVLEGRDLSVRFTLGRASWWGATRTLNALDNVSITLRQGQTIGVVGESGSGKSTLARALLKLVQSSGSVSFDQADISNLSRKEMRPLRRQLQIVFQDPFGSLSPRMTAGQIVTEGLMVHSPGLTSAERDAEAARAFSAVSLDPQLRNRYPHEFSGGQRQRIAIARVLVLHPKVLVLDEPTSALDRSVQKQVIELLRELQRVHNMAYLFISHDLAVVQAMADYIVIMQNGRVVEQGDSTKIFSAPESDYTRKLMAAAHLGVSKDIRRSTET